MSAPQIAIDGFRYYVYALIDPIEYRKTGSQLLSVIYVGKGLKDRVAHHEKAEIAALEAAANTVSMAGSKADRIRFLLGSGERIPSVMLSSGIETEQDAYRVEAIAMELIGRLLRAYGQQPLGNLTPGHGQSKGLEVSGSSQIFGETSGEPLAVIPSADGDDFEWTPVWRALLASTSSRASWREVIKSKTLLVKGTAEPMLGGTHLPATDDGSLGEQDRVLWKATAITQDSEFERRGYDPDAPWTDHEARGRAARYWPIGRARMVEWLSDPSLIPEHLLLAIPGNGGTTVRYAWSIDSGGVFEYYPEMGRWGLPLGDRVLTHAALGKTLVEDKGDGARQVLAGYAAGWRILDPQI